MSSFLPKLRRRNPFFKVLLLHPVISYFVQLDIIAPCRRCGGRWRAAAATDGVRYRIRRCLKRLLLLLIAVSVLGRRRIPVVLHDVDRVRALHDICCWNRFDDDAEQLFVNVNVGRSFVACATSVFFDWELRCEDESAFLLSVFLRRSVHAPAPFLRPSLG